MTVILNGRSVLFSPQPGRPVNCGTASICETQTRTAVVIVGCGGGNCKTKSELCQDQGTYLQYIRNMTDQAGNVLDVSSSSLVFSIYTTVTGTLLLTRTTAAGTIDRVSTSRVQWEINSADSAALTPGSHYYEFWVVDSTGERYLAECGTFKLNDTRNFDA